MIGFESGDTNFYRYVKNRPLSYVDPTGESGAIAVATLTCAGILGIAIEDYLRQEKKKTCEKKNKEFLTNDKSFRVVSSDGMVIISDCSKILDNPSWVDPPLIRVPDPRAKSK